MDQFVNMETPVSYQVAGGLALIGATLRRNVCLRQGGAGSTWPNMSVLLVGPSGIGKDTIINKVEDVIRATASARNVPGITIEMVKQEMVKLGNPAAGYIMARELSSFLGKKDYQAGMLTDLTNILSTGDEVDVSTKYEGIKKIPRPTLTMFAGTTVKWLHTQMPDGTLDGGFLPRFFVVSEEYPRKQVALPGDYTDAAERAAVQHAIEAFNFCVSGIHMRYRARSENLMILDDAKYFYTNWYSNRSKYFSPLVEAYAHRSRGLCLQLAMLMAVSRSHNYIDLTDVVFGTEMIQYAAKRLEECVIPPSKEVVVGRAVLKNLPITHHEALRTFVPVYGMRSTKEGIAYLLESRQIEIKGGMLQRV